MEAKASTFNWRLIELRGEDSRLASPVGWNMKLRTGTNCLQRAFLDCSQPADKNTPLNTLLPGFFVFCFFQVHRASVYDHHTPLILLASPFL